jgi:tetratricopeptide (TPR) repeat protein
MKGIYFTALLAMLWYGCGDDSSGPNLESMPHPDLSQVSEPLLLEAIQKARNVIDSVPDSAAAWAHLGHLYFIHGWEDEAISYYQHATEIDSDEFRWLYYLGRALHEKEPSRAVDVLARALALEPKYPPAYIYCAYALRNLGRFEQARQYFEQALELDPKNFFAHLGLGQLALAARQFEAARRILQQALGLDSKRGEVHSALAQVALALGQNQTASQHAQAARKHIKNKRMNDPLWRRAERVGSTPYWFSKRGEYYLSQGNFAAALAEFSKLDWEGEYNPVYWCNYGTALLGLKRTEEAIAALEKALGQTRLRGNEGKTEPRDLLRIYNTLGQAQLQTSDLKKAEYFMQQALNLDPTMMQVVFNLALIYDHQERLDEAIVFLQNTAGVKDHPQTSQLLDTLLRKRLGKMD